MEKWRYILLAGIILGMVIITIDFLVVSVPYIVIIPMELISLVLIFAGFIMRKNKIAQEKQGD